MKKLLKRLSFTALIILCLGIAIPQNLKMPVQGATDKDYNTKSFWFYPWGKSGTHKGVDIFAKSGTPIHSGTAGIVIRTGHNSMGGNYVLILGPKWRMHYYAHLKSINTKQYSFVNKKTKIGAVGASGNAKGKAPHLHYTIATLIPYPWRIDQSVQGERKIFYLNPIDYL